MRVLGSRVKNVKNGVWGAFSTGLGKKSASLDNYMLVWKGILLRKGIFGGRYGIECFLDRFSRFFEIYCSIYLWIALETDQAVGILFSLSCLFIFVTTSLMNPARVASEPRPPLSHSFPFLRLLIFFHNNIILATLDLVKFGQLNHKVT